MNPVFTALAPAAQASFHRYSGGSGSGGYYGGWYGGWGGGWGGSWS